MEFVHLDIGSERIVGDRQGSRKRKYCATQLPYLLPAHENKAIHIHDDGVLTGGENFA
jgi:hypothetical protein